MGSVGIQRVGARECLESNVVAAVGELGDGKSAVESGCRPGFARAAAALEKAEAGKVADKRVALCGCAEFERFLVGVADIHHTKGAEILAKRTRTAVLSRGRLIGGAQPAKSARLRRQAPA